jgi:hypothetical protein
MRNSIDFGAGSAREELVLYDGPYKPGPYNVWVNGGERGQKSDHEFSDGVVNLSLDLSRLRGSASATISQIPAGMGDKDGGDSSEDPDDLDAIESYTIFFSAEVRPAVKLLGADVKKNKIEIELSPDGASGNLTIRLQCLEGVEKEIYSAKVAGGRFTQGFHLDQFTPGDGEVTLTSVEAQWDTRAAGRGYRSGKQRARQPAGPKAKWFLHPAS